MLDVQKAYNSASPVCVRGKMWRVIKRMYEYSKSAVLLDGEQSEAFDVEQGVAQGYSLSPILFSVLINGGRGT